MKLSVQVFILISSESITIILVKNENNTSIKKISSYLLPIRHANEKKHNKAKLLNTMHVLQNDDNDKVNYYLPIPIFSEIFKGPRR